jgi:undecaprenyl-diphosphatase
VIQLGAILAVVVLFFHKLNPFALSKTKTEKHDTWILWTKVAVGVLPAAILGLLFDDWLDANLYNYITVAITLVVYGVLFIVVETKRMNTQPTIQSLSSLTYKTALFIGFFQVLSLIPGTSRSGATILGAILLGTSRFVAAEFSFFLSIPVMFGASALKLYKFGFAFSSTELMILLVGMATAFVVSILAIKFLLGYIKQHDFKVFGWYRIALGLIVILYFVITTS